jgi:hypothetical protein
MELEREAIERAEARIERLKYVLNCAESAIDGLYDAEVAANGGIYLGTSEGEFVKGAIGGTSWTPDQQAIFDQEMHRRAFEAREEQSHD